MASTVEGYLAELRTALAGADPALVQDALYDAEEYLRTAAAEAGNTPEAVAGAIDAYGTPEEVAQAYRDADEAAAAVMRTPAPHRSQTWYGRFFGVAGDFTAWGGLLYMFLALVTGIIYFTIVVTGLSLVAGLMVLIIGIPIALLFIAMVRAISLIEGRIVEALLGVRMPRKPRGMAPTGNIWERLKSWFTDYHTWTTMLYMVVQLFFGILYFTLAVTGLVTSVALVAWPIAQLVIGQPIARDFQYGYMLHWWAMPLVMIAGVLLFFGTLWLAKGVGYLHGQYAKVMLVGRTEGSAS